MPFSQAEMQAQYDRSTLDWSYLGTLASKVAIALSAAGARVDGYTDETAKEYWRETGRSVLLKRLFGESTSLDHQHLGFWLLQSISSTVSITSSNRESYNLAGKTYSYRPGREIRRCQSWALLTNGVLAREWRMYEYVAPDGNAAARPSGGHKDDVWAPLEGDVYTLMLDHKTREVYRGRPGASRHERGTLLDTNHPLITGKKGGGCKKLLIRLGEKHGIDARRL